jgi:hypothetical protein
VTKQLKDLGRAAASSGWRGKVADRAAPAVAKRTPASHDGARAAIGLVFLAITLLNLARVLKRYRAAHAA